MEEREDWDEEDGVEEACETVGERRLAGGRSDTWE